MGTRGWTLPAFVGCCLWILHGLGAAVAVPVTTEGPFGAHTASPTAAPSEARGALPLGAAGTSTAVADTETTESILAGRPASPSFPSGAEADLVTTTSAPTSAPAAGSDAEAGLSPSAATQAPSGEPQAVTDVATSLNASQGNQTVSAAALVFTPQPAFTPSAELDVTAAAPAAPPGATPLFADMSKDILASVTREGADLEPTADATSLPATLPPAATGAEPTTGSPLGPHVTALLSQGQATATGAAEEGVTLPGDSQGEGSAPSSIPSPGAGGLLTTRWDEVPSGSVGVTSGPAALGSGDAGDAVNGAVGTTDSSHLAPENGTVSGAAENPGQTSLLAGQAGLSPATSPGPAGGGDGDVQGAPAVSPASPGSAPAPAAPEAPGERGDTATSLLASRAPTDAQSDTDAPAPSITLPLPTGAVGPAEPSLQPAPWHSPTGERQPQLAAALPSPTDTPSAPGAAFPPPGAAAGDGAETTANPDLGAAPGVPALLSPGRSQPWGTAAAAPEGADGAGTIPNSALDAASLASSGPNGLAGPAQGDTADTAQAGDTGDSSPYAGTQGDTSSSSSSAQQGPADTAELPAAPAGALPSTKLSPAAAPGDGAGAAPAPGEVSPPGPMAPGHVGLEPNLSGAEGPGPLPSQAPGAPSAAFPPPVAAASGAAFGTSNGAETAANPDLGAAQGAPISPFLVGSQPWGVAAGAPTGAALPGAEGPGNDFSSTLDAPGSASHGPVGPPSPTLGVQPGADLGVLGAEGQALGGSRTGSGPSPSSSPGAGMEAGTDLLPGAVSLPGPASPGDTLPISSTLENGAAAPMPAAAPGPDRLSQGSPYSETGPELATAQGTESAGNTAEAANPGSRSPYTDTSSSSSSAQQGPADTAELPAAPAGALPSTELSPAAAPGDGAGAAPAPEVSPPGPMAPGYVGLEPDLSGAEGLGPSQAPGVAFPPPPAASGAAFGTSDGAETAANPDLGAAQGAPISPFLVGSQPWGVAAGAPTGAALPGAEGPGTGFSSALDAPGSASRGPVGPPSPTLGVLPGADLGVPGAEGQALGGSRTGSEPSLSSSPGAGMEAGTDLLPGAVSLPGPASPGDTLTAPSVLDSASPGALGGVDAALSAVQPALGAGPGAHPPAGGGGGEGAGAGNGESPGVSQDLDGAAGASGGGTGAVLHSASPSPSPEGSSSAPTRSGAAEGAGGPGAGGAGVGLSPDPEAAGPQGNEETPVPAPGIQSGADLGLSDANLSQTNVVQLAGGETGASAPWAPAPGAGTADGAGAIIQITSGVLAPSVLSSPREVQPQVPVAPDASSPLLAASAGGVGGSSAPAPNGGPPSASGTPSGSSPSALGSPLAAVVAGAGSALPGSPEYEMSSGMAAPLGEESPRAPAPANAAPALPPASEREDAAAGAAAGPPPVSSPVSGSEWGAGTRGELGAAVGGAAPFLPPLQPGGPVVPPRPSVAEGRGDTDGPVPGEPRPGVSVGPGGAGGALETPTQPLAGGSPGSLSVLPPAGPAAGSPLPNIPGPGPAGGSSPPALHPSLGSATPANGLPAAGGASIPAPIPGHRVAQGGSPPPTLHPAVSCSPTLPAPSPGGKKGLPGPRKNEAASLATRASSSMLPAPPRSAAAAPVPPPGPTVAAVSLYGYGPRENDREYVERRVDFNSPLFKPETGFPFGKTLRDSLYFTDNGQIIFPASDSSIPAYPNPPPGGFNGHEEVPMIAVFWDNADFSRGTGTTFYQEFLTLNSEKPPFIRDVEAKVRRYLRSSYSAAWTLKVTWDKAPAYGARGDSRRTNTYQAVLTTDGFRSYVLLLYQDGGMRWDYSQLPAANVLIGYTSGDGSYHNDDLTQGPPAAKYRPDQFRGYNTDLRGLWLYKLESRVGINYRLKCLAWTGQQQEPRTWSQDLPACPCSLQQGQQDPRFKSSRGGWWSARVSMLHSASPNRYGAGVRCLYDSRGQLVEGRQERYWRSSRQASPYRDQELKLYDWCCNQAASARLCARYGEKRPRIGCDGYQALGMADSSEDNDSEEQRDEEDE